MRPFGTYWEVVGFKNLENLRKVMNDFILGVTKLEVGASDSLSTREGAHNSFMCVCEICKKEYYPT